MASSIQLIRSANGIVKLVGLERDLCRLIIVKLRDCPRCRKRFEVHRKQSYCSTACNQAERNARKKRIMEIGKRYAR